LGWFRATFSGKAGGWSADDSDTWVFSAILPLHSAFLNQLAVKELHSMMDDADLLERVDGTAVETTLRRRVVVGFTVAALLTGLMSFLSWYNAKEAAAESDWVEHTQGVLLTLASTLSHLVDVDTGGKAFAISGHESYLRPHQTGMAGVTQDLNALRRLTADNPTQQQACDVLEPQVRAKIQTSAMLVAARRQTGAIPTDRQLTEGEQLMDAVRATVQQMNAEEERLLKDRSQKTRASRRLTILATLLGSFLGLGFLVTAGLAINREIGVSARGRAQVNALNAHLERRVEQRTAALGESEFRLEKLNEVLELRVTERTAQLKEVNKELESFTYSVAHDLRAPLRHVAGFSGILVEEFSSSLDPQAQSYLQRIQEGTRKMGVLVDELLSLSRVGRQELNLQQAGLNSIVKEVLEILQPEIEGRQVEWKIADLPFVECDRTLLKQVFQNLISNALKYSCPRPLAIIEIGQTQKNGHPAFFVRDNGVGFNIKYADKLFGVFQRLHRSEDFEGTGVGLATVARIIKKHQGKVWAEAELDKGATFYFTIGGLQPAETTRQTTAMGA
jgi:signal transduction histidine kinase